MDFEFMRLARVAHAASDRTRQNLAETSAQLLSFDPLHAANTVAAVGLTRGHCARSRGRSFHLVAAVFQTAVTVGGRVGLSVTGQHCGREARKLLGQSDHHSFVAGGRVLDRRVDNDARRPSDQHLSYAQPSVHDAGFAVLPALGSS